MCNTYYFTVHLSFCNSTSLPPSPLTPKLHPSPVTLTPILHPSPLTLTHHLSTPPLTSSLHLSPLTLHSSPQSLIPLPFSPPLHSLPLHPSDLPLVTGQLWHSLELWSCVQSANPLCGWCSTEGRCMATDSCSTAGTFTGHNNASSCPAITNVSPEQAYIVNNEMVSCTLQ